MAHLTSSPRARCYTRRRFLRSCAVAATGGFLSWSVFPSRASAQADGVSIGGGHVIQPRDIWGADLQPTGPMELEAPGDVRFLLVHHSASPNGYGADRSIGYVRSFYNYHTSDAKGWPDVAYNFLVDEHGQIFEGRQGSLDSPVRGDATGGSQGYAILACFIGDHQDAPPTVAAQSAMVALLAWLAGTYQIDPSPGATAEFISRGSNRHPAGSLVVTPTITGHRTMSHTTCPGDRAYPLVRDSFPQQVSMLLGAGSASIPSTTTAATTTPLTTSTTTAPDVTASAPTTAISETSTTETTTGSSPPEPVPATTTTEPTPRPDPPVEMAADTDHNSTTSGVVIVSTTTTSMPSASVSDSEVALSEPAPDTVPPRPPADAVAAELRPPLTQRIIDLSVVAALLSAVVAPFLGIASRRRRSNSRDSYQIESEWRT